MYAGYTWSFTPPTHELSVEQGQGIHCTDVEPRTHKQIKSWMCFELVWFGVFLSPLTPHVSYALPLGHIHTNLYGCAIPARREPWPILTAIKDMRLRQLLSFGS